MMRKRLNGIIIIGACLAILTWSFISMGHLVEIRYLGKEVKAIVVDVPIECDRYNHIKVMLAGKEHEVTISRTDCRKGVYKNGQEVTLLKYKNYDDLVWPGSRPEWTIVLIIGLLILVYLTNRKHFHK